MYAEFVFYPRTQQETQANFFLVVLVALMLHTLHWNNVQQDLRMHTQVRLIIRQTAVSYCCCNLLFIFIFYYLFYFLIIGKKKKPTRTYNATVDHHRRFLNVTPGHPGRWNDKTLVVGFVAFEAFRGTNLVLPLNCNCGAIVSINHATATKSEEKSRNSNKVRRDHATATKSEEIFNIIITL